MANDYDIDVLLDGAEDWDWNDMMDDVFSPKPKKTNVRIPAP